MFQSTCTYCTYTQKHTHYTPNKPPNLLSLSPSYTCTHKTHTLRRNYFELGVSRRECSWEQQGHEALWEVRWGPAFPPLSVCALMCWWLTGVGGVVVHVRPPGPAIRLPLLRVALCHCKRLWCSPLSLSHSFYKPQLTSDSGNFGIVMLQNQLFSLTEDKMRRENYVVFNIDCSLDFMHYNL